MSSGGIKSAVAAARYASEHELTLVHVSYGQLGAGAEIDAVRALAGCFSSARWITLDLPTVAQFRASSSKPTDAGPPSDLGGPEGKASLPAASVRGLLPAILSVGLQCASQAGVSIVVTGLSRFCDAVHLGHFSPDGRPDRLHEFLQTFNTMAESLTPQAARVSVEAPLADIGYREIVKLALRFELPLDKTWTCQGAGPRPCRACGPCNARTRAFTESAMMDPLAAPLSPLAATPQGGNAQSRRTHAS